MCCLHLHSGSTEADEAREQALVKLAVLLESHGLHHGRKLVVVPDQNDALQPTAQHRVQILRNRQDLSVFWLKE